MEILKMLIRLRMLSLIVPILLVKWCLPSRKSTNGSSVTTFSNFIADRKYADMVGKGRVRAAITDEEAQRIGQYADRIKAADGSLGVLTDDERVDLEQLVQKRINDGEHKRK